MSGILIFRRHLRHRRLLRADLVACGLPAIPYFSVIWDLEDDPEGNFQHIAENGVTREEVEEILDLPGGVDRSRSSGRPIVFGETSAGRMIAVVFEEIDADSVYPITAYEVES